MGCAHGNLSILILDVLHRHFVEDDRRGHRARESAKERGHQHRQVVLNLERDKETSCEAAHFSRSFIVVRSCVLYFGEVKGDLSDSGQAKARN